MIPWYVAFVLLGSHLAMFAAGLYSAHMARKLVARPIYKPILPQQAKAQEKSIEAMADKMAKDMQFAYLDGLRKGAEEIQPAFAPSKKAK